MEKSCKTCAHHQTGGCCCAGYDDWEPKEETTSNGLEVAFKNNAHLIAQSKPNKTILRTKGFRVFIDNDLQEGVEGIEISNHGTILAAVVEIYNPNEDNDKIKTLITDARLNNQGSLDLHLITFKEEI